MEGNNIIEVRGLCKSFGNLQVLNDISTDFKENQVVSIIGPSGGGKSTFLRCLNLLESPTSGQIIFHDVDLCSKKIDINVPGRSYSMMSTSAQRKSTSTSTGRR